MHLITVIKWELFRKYHIKQYVFRDDISKTKNILSFHTVSSGAVFVYADSLGRIFSVAILS